MPRRGEAGGNPCFQLAENRAFAEWVGWLRISTSIKLSALPRGKGDLRLRRGSMFNRNTTFAARSP